MDNPSGADSSSSPTTENLHGQVKSPPGESTQRSQIDDLLREIRLEAEIAVCREQHQKEQIAQEAADAEYGNKWSPVVNCYKSEGNPDWSAVCQDRLVRLCDYLKARECDKLFDRVHGVGPESWALKLFALNLAKQSSQALECLQGVESGSSGVESGSIGLLLDAYSSLKKKLEFQVRSQRFAEVGSALSGLQRWGIRCEVEVLAIGPDGNGDERTENYLLGWARAIFGLKLALRNHHLLFSIAAAPRICTSYRAQVWHKARRMLQAGGTTEAVVLRSLRHCIMGDPDDAVALADCFKNEIQEFVRSTFRERAEVFMTNEGFKESQASKISSATIDGTAQAED